MGQGFYKIISLAGLHGLTRILPGPPARRRPGLRSPALPGSSA